MIKAAGQQDDGKPLLVLGLSRVNTERLLEGQPIPISAEEMVSMGLPELAIILMAGETESSIAQALGQVLPQPQPGQTVRSGSPKAPHGRRA